MICESETLAQFECVSGGLNARLSYCSHGNPILAVLKEIFFFFVISWFGRVQSAVL